MSAPNIVTSWPDFCGGWIELDGEAWITANVKGDAPLSQVRVAHNDPATGKQCKDSTASLGAHELVSRDPITIKPSLACGACSWHGYITNGAWVPA